MQGIALVCTAAFVIVGAVVGARILLLAWRTGKRPELYLGGSLFLYAGIGQPFIVASRPLGAVFGFEGRFLAIALAVAAIVASMISLYLFTWTVFRRGSWAARALVWTAGIAAAALGATVLGSLPETPGVVTDGIQIGVAGLSVVFSVGMSWTAWEALHYHGMMRRRLALGLADPIVANRFLLWGCGCATTVLTSIAMIASVAARLDVATHPAPLLLTSVGGAVIASCWYLSFLPPEGYLRWLSADAAAQEA